MRLYDHQKIEKKWRTKWEEAGLSKTPDEKKGAPNFFLLVEYPYPSGNLHLGHWYAFAPPDIFARKKRMEGKNVLFPIGFDSFGLPAENAAIKRGLDPKEWTYANIRHMTEQLKTMGSSFDWSRAVAASDPEYYRWTQWLFIQFWKRGLAYREEASVHWCPSCKTVLANEQVADGRCERCDTVVAEKTLKQWFLKITDYAERLLSDLRELDWPREIKEAQKNWIGKSEGALIKFQIPDLQFSIEVFTTRADTLFGATYIVLSPEHKAITEIQDAITNKDEVFRYIERAREKATTGRTVAREKTGVELKGVNAINPATKEGIPVWVADYVLGDVGTGAIMAVPAHDERDCEFAKKYDLPVRKVIEPSFVQTTDPGKVKDGLPFDHRDAIIAVVKHWSEEKYLVLKWKQVAWLTFVTGGIEEGQTAEEAAKTEIREEAGYRNPVLVRDFGVLHGRFYHVPKRVNRHAHARTLLFRLKDGKRDAVDPEEMEKHDALWLAPEELGKQLTPDSHKYALKLISGEITSYAGEGFLTNSGEFNGMSSAEARKKITEFIGGTKKTAFKLHDWLISRQRYWGTPIPIVYDPRGTPHAVPEDKLPWLLPDDVDFTPTGKAPLARSEELKERTRKLFGEGWTPEADTMDTFVDSSWYFLRYLDTKNSESFSSKEKQKQWMPVQLYSGGAEHTTMHLLYSRFFHKALFDMGLATAAEPYKRRMNRGLILGPDGHKMSKSRGNVVDPDDSVRRFGADAVRMYLAFVGPYDEAGSYPWDVGGLVGVERFLRKVWRLAGKIENDAPEACPQKQVGNAGMKTESLLHKTIKKVSEDIEALRFNTAISALMIFANELGELDKVPASCYGELLKLLAPFAPHCAEELWQTCGFASGTEDSFRSIHEAAWPLHDERKMWEDVSTIVVQINGKVRGSFEAEAGENEEAAEKKALALDSVKKWTEGKEIKKIIHVQGKLVNVVCREQGRV